jgi:glycosyltransferase involved in cell wall biosynthesis
MQTTIRNSPTKIAFIGNYLPRKCGIATFTADLYEAVAEAQPDSDCFVLAMNDPGAEYNYPAQVRFEIQQNSLADYRSAADFLNLADPSVVCLQHEYGIFGGEAGSYILAVLEDLNIPVVTTLHTVMQYPTNDQYQVMRQLTDLSSRLIVMSKRGVNYLTQIYAVAPEKIDVIPHGIPDVPFTDPNFYKDKLRVEGQQVLLTFGLLSPNKGIEHVIRALPEILTQVPNLVYVILGATHPSIKRKEGESYRESLKQLAERLGVAENVQFHDRFVELDELIEYIGAADIYVTPYLNRSQIVSGTLAYAVGAGKPVISTPYWYAEELLAQGRGILVPFEDAPAIAEQAIRLLQDEAKRHAMRKQAYLYGRAMTWSQAAKRYLKSFERAKMDFQKAIPVEGLILPVLRASRAMTGTIPKLRLDHRRD